MTNRERMIKGLVYDPADSEIADEQIVYLDKLARFNALLPSQYEEKLEYMRSVFAECGDGCYIELPFRANWGGHHLHLGSGVYANFNLTLVDDGHIYIGDKVMIGPNVTIATASHPVSPELRERALQYNSDVHIGRNVWIGAGAIILPGVTIGENSIIGAGAVVTKDIPAGVIAVGNPAKVMRTITAEDGMYIRKTQLIDLENL